MSHRGARRGQKKQKQLSYEMQTIGLPPGTLISMPGIGDSRIECLRYNVDGSTLSYKLPMLFDVIPSSEMPSEGNEVEETKQQTPGKDKYVHWINIENPGKDVLSSLTDYYGVHALVLEDIQNPLPRPKLEEYSNNLYVTVQVPVFTNGEPDRQSISLICGCGYIISFFHKDDAILASLRSRIGNDQGRIRRMAADYLLFSILDEAVDRSFPFIEQMESSIEDLEEEVLQTPSKENMVRILSTKREVSGLRHYIWPMTEVIGSMHRTHSPLVTSEVRLYLRDIADHGMHLTDRVNSLRDMASSLLDVYHSSTASNLNKVIKVLTLISTIFIPPTFIVGWYGMNFKNMPEYDTPWAYPAVLIVMASIGIGMVVWFKKQKWI